MPGLTVAIPCFYVSGGKLNFWQRVAFPVFTQYSRAGFEQPPLLEMVEISFRWLLPPEGWFLMTGDALFPLRLKEASVFLKPLFSC